MNDPNANRPGYKKTEVGWIPVEWKVSQIGAVCEQPRSGYSANAADFPASEDSVGVLKLSCIDAGRFRSECNKAVVSRSEQARLTTPVTANSIIISRSNTEELVGVATFVAADHANLFLSDLMWQLIPRAGMGSSMRWFAFLLGSRPLRNRIVASANGTSGSMKKITKPSLMALPIPLPPQGEREKIASILSTCDDVIERTRELIAAKREQKKGLMQQLLTGKRRLRGYRDPWSQPYLGDLAEDVARRNNGKLGKDRLYAVTKAEGLVPMRAHVMGESVERCKVVERDWFAYNPMRINVGSLALWEGPDEVMVSGDYVVFRCFDRKLAPPYFNHLRRTGRWEHFVRNSGNGSVRIRLYFDDIAEFRFPCPGIDEQRAIASVLTAADAEIAALERKLTALREQKRGLMQRLLTGAIRVGVGR
ncbi:MAG: restriction endonuclease subunit S [Verrucomicrobiae bacterium]|nr:restriction endonuclease subunit S [Verrucomicrobiae bacterium]